MAVIPVDYSDSMIRLSDLRSEPYRILFPLGLLGGVSGILHWLFFALGGQSAGLTLHVALQVPGYIGIAGAGFLATALPRLTQSPGASRPEFGVLLAASGALLLVPLSNSLPLVATAFALDLAFLALFTARRFHAARNAGRTVPTSFRWVFMAVLLAGAGCLLASAHPRFAVRLLTQGYVFPLIMAVAPFVGPNYLRREKERCAPTYALRVPLAGDILPASLFVLSFLLEGWAGEGELLLRPAYLLRGLVLVFLLHRADLLAPPSLRLPLLHATFIAGFSLMFLMIATRVVRMHGGRRDFLEIPYRPAWAMGSAVVAAAAFRMAADFFPELYFHLIGCAAGLWLLAHFLFFILLGRYLFRLPEPSRS